MINLQNIQTAHAPPYQKTNKQMIHLHFQKGKIKERVSWWLSGNLPAHAGGKSLIPGLRRSSGEGNSYPLQDSGLGDPMDRGAWWAMVPGVAKSWT